NRSGLLSIMYTEAPKNRMAKSSGCPPIATPMPSGLVGFFCPSWLLLLLTDTGSLSFIHWISLFPLPKHRFSLSSIRWISLFPLPNTGSLSPLSVGSLSFLSLT
ncbi:hypothetical protein NDU88_003563, partial [Pleurodeles waltl]